MRLRFISLFAGILAKITTLMQANVLEAGAKGLNKPCKKVN